MPLSPPVFNTFRAMSMVMIAAARQALFRTNGFPRPLNSYITRRRSNGIHSRIHAAACRRRRYHCGQPPAVVGISAKRATNRVCRDAQRRAHCVNAVGYAREFAIISRCVFYTSLLAFVRQARPIVGRLTRLRAPIDARFQN